MIKNIQVLKCAKINSTKKNNARVYNCYTEISQEEALKSSIPKVIINNRNELVYMSRSTIPFNQSKLKINYYKQVCIYSYPRNILKNFNNKKSKVEKNEDIEILRLIENGIKIKMIKVNTSSFAIDTKDDLINFKKLI